jgi:2-polyprenyl-3-methyl-5-hydroxy-6-metoxy-1,4-benzoquinol methylase/glycosyltransferase involved in cell wall biosynthesis
MTQSEERTGSSDAAATETPDLYGKDYFEKHCGPTPYRRDVPQWAEFFGDVADELIRSLRPRTVLDVGCAIGFLVEAFWRRGVRAYGIDISEYAISQIPQDLKSFCWVLSATDPLPDDFPQTYDLITCIEVLEHIPEEGARVAIRKMASRTDCILFSSTPHDLTEPTHVNVRPIIYWLQLFAEIGFYPDLRFDASFVSPQAFLIRKGTPRLQEDALPFFSDSINKKFQINSQQEQIVGLTRSKQELQQHLEGEVGKRDKEIENLRGARSNLEAQVRTREQEATSLRSTNQQLTHEMNRLRIEKLEPLEREAESLRSTAQQLRQEISQLQTLLTVKNLEVAEQGKKIASLELAQSGLFWQLLVAYRGTKDRLFPIGSKRRALYDKLLSRVKAFKSVAQERAELTLVEGMPRLGIDHRPQQLISPTLHRFGLIISGCPGDAFRYRCEHQAEQLRFFGLTVETAYFDQVDYRAALEQYQCYWLHRVPHTPIVEEFIRGAQLIGKPVIFDTDDLIFDEEKIPYIRALQWMSEDELGLYHDGVRRYHRTLSLCRFATVTTEPLRDAVLRLSPQVRCFINPNTLSDEQLALADDALKFSRPSEDQEVIRIAYLSGTHTHNVDFQECSGALQSVMDAYPRVRLMLVGHLDVGSEFERFRDRVERYPLLPWQELPKLFRKIDINLAPLELNNPFTEAKSALKYFEAAVMGVPTVASDVKAFRTSIRNGENGYLCRTEEEWVRCLGYLVQDERLRREMGSLARKEVLENCTTRAGAPHFTKLSRKIVEKGPLSLKKHLSIAFILRAPIAQVGGGYKNIFQLAHYLANRNHEVNIYVEPIAHLEGKSWSEIVEFCNQYFGKSPAQIHVGHENIKTCDVAVATNWPTAFVVNNLTNAICKAYLIQDFEPEFYEHENPLYKEAEKTYALPLKKITLGRHLANLFERKDRLPVTYIDFALDHGIFNTQHRKKAENKVKILFFARPALKRRGFGTGVEALRRVNEIYPEVEICLYGIEEKEALPFPYTNLGMLSPAELSQAMCNSDIHLSISLTNISYVPFEAMACGCAVVEAKVSSVEAMVADGTHCLLAEPKGEAVADALLRLIADTNLRERVAKAGIEFVQNKTWDNSCKRFEEILCDSLLIDRKVSTDITQAMAKGSAEEPPRSVTKVSTRHVPRTAGIFYRSCNFCGGVKFGLFKKMDVPFPNRIYGDSELSYPDVGKRLKLQYLECTECGLVGINPLTRFDDINRNTFDGERNIVAWADLDYKDYAADKFNTIKIIYDDYEFESYRQTNRVLDVSCGPGVSLSWLRDVKGWKIFGIDPDRYSVKTAWERYSVRIENGLIYDLKMPDEHFDLIVMDNSLEHTFDPLSTLLKAFRLLRKGGSLFIFTPNCYGLSTRFLDANAHWGHWFLYSPKTVVDVLRRIGYEVPKLIAIQNPVNPALLEKGIDLNPYREGLEVSLTGAEVVENQIGKISIYSDYFNLIAVKPLNCEVAVERETELSNVAGSSLEQLERVDIVTNESDGLGGYPCLSEIVTSAQSRSAHPNSPARSGRGLSCSVDAPVRGVFYRRCNFCGEAGFRVFKRMETPFPKRIYGDQELSYPDVGQHLKLQYLECIGCGLVGINPLTQFSDINRNSFDGEQNIVAWADLDYSWYEADKLKTIALIYDQYDFDSYKCTNRILDVSCGPGVSLSWLRNEKSWEVFGIDPDRYSARTAWERYGVRIDNGLIENVQSPDEQFDLMIMDNSLEHTFNPLATLVKAFRLLRKGGGLFIATPNCHGLATRFLNENAHWGHWFLYSPKVLYDILSRIGFKVTVMFAAQECVKQAIVDQGYNIEPYMDGLRISLVGEEAVSSQIGKKSYYADYFQIMALKPMLSGRTPELEAALMSISEASLEQQENVDIEVSCGFNDIRMSAPAPIYPDPVRNNLAASGPDRSLERLISEAKKLRAPWILNIGSRNVRGALGVDCQSWFENVGKFVGVDLEPGPGVDIVTDASLLSRVIRPHSFDIVVSVSVFEHLRQPWKVVLEINKILRTGGLVFIHSHQTFPLHDYPGDFFRFSEEAFKELFSKNLGFEVLTTGSQVPCRVVPVVEIPGWLNDHQAYINTTVCARKVADVDPSVYRWG